MIVHREVNVRHNDINIAREAPNFEYFFAKLRKTIFEINKLNLS